MVDVVMITTDKEWAQSLVICSPPQNIIQWATNSPAMAIRICMVVFELGR